MRLIDADALMEQLKKERDRLSKIPDILIGTVFEARIIELDEAIAATKQAPTVALSDDAWELLGEICGECDVADYSVDYREIFGDGYDSLEDVIRALTYEETKARFESWKNQKELEELKVGDVIQYSDEHNAYSPDVILAIKNNRVYTIDKNGETQDLYRDGIGENYKWIGHVYATTAFFEELRTFDD